MALFPANPANPAIVATLFSRADLPVFYAVFKKKKIPLVSMELSFKALINLSATTDFPLLCVECISFHFLLNTFHCQ